MFDTHEAVKNIMAAGATEELAEAIVEAIKVAVEVRDAEALRDYEATRRFG